MVRKMSAVLAVMALCLFIPCAWAQLTINIVAVNGQDEAKTMNVVYPLPKELDPGDVLDKGPLEMDYDVDNASYYVHKEIDFKPKETKTFKVRVNDVWKINPEDINIIKQQLDSNLDGLKGTDIFPQAQDVRDKLVAQMDYILSQQELYSDNIERRIEQYRQHKSQLDYIRKNAYDVDFLENEAKALEDINEQKTVKFHIEVKNPSETEEKTVNEKHYLPSEVRDEDVLDKQGFEVRFDEKKGKCYLSKEELFAPDETKKYEIVIRDIWQFPFDKLNTIEESANVAMAELEESIYRDSGTFLFNAITGVIEEIRATRDLDVPVKEHIGLYRLNMKRFKELEDDLTRLEQLLALARAKRLEQLEEGRVKNVLQKLKALRGLQALSEALFKKGISVTMTWKIIFGAIIFVALFTALHFFIWSKRSKALGEDMGLPDGEKIKEVPKPGSEKEEDTS